MSVSVRPDDGTMARPSHPPVWWAAMSLAGAAVFLVVIVMVLSVMNQERQATVNQRQAFLNQTQALNGINQALVTALAQASVRDNDVDARTLLASEGITATANPAPGAGVQK